VRPLLLARSRPVLVAPKLASLTGPVSCSPAGTTATTRRSRRNTSEDDGDEDDEDDESSSDEDGDYIQNKKKHPKKRARAAAKRTARDFELPRVSSRNGKALPNYDESGMFDGISDSDDEGWEYDASAVEQEQRASLVLFLLLFLLPRALTLTRPPFFVLAAAGDGIDGVFAHKRDEAKRAPLRSRTPSRSDLADPTLTPRLLLRAVDDAEDDPKRNMRFLIKWQGYSHIHDTWETYQHLRGFKGFKRVENYIKGVYYAGIALMENPDLSREDLEAVHLDRERKAEELEHYKIVERIISQRDAPANQDVDHDHGASSSRSLPASPTR